MSSVMRGGPWISNRAASQILPASCDGGGPKNSRRMLLCESDSTSRSQCCLWIYCGVSGLSGRSDEKSSFGQTKPAFPNRPQYHGRLARIRSRNMAQTVAQLDLSLYTLGRRFPLRSAPGRPGRSPGSSTRGESDWARKLSSPLWHNPCRFKGATVRLPWPSASTAWSIQSDDRTIRVGWLEMVLQFSARS